MPAPDQGASARRGDTVRDQLFEAIQELLLGGGLHYSAAQLADATGADREMARKLWRAMGFANVPDNEIAFADADLDALGRTCELMRADGLDPADVLHLTRVLGQATARIAESVIGFSADRLFGSDRPFDPGRPFAPEQPGDGQVSSAATELAPELLLEVDHLVVYLLNRHLLDAAIRRLPSDVRAEPSTAVAVGFADLVGFTRLSQELRDAEIADLVEHFESIASDTVVANGGRVVKMIGDEVMWSAPSGQAAEIALLLTESFDSPNLPGVRVGLACGAVVTRAGDLFGPTVNLASRATGVAHPGTVLASSDLFDVVETDSRYRLKKLRARRLKGLGLVELGVVQRA